MLHMKDLKNIEIEIDTLIDLKEIDDYMSKVNKNTKELFSFVGRLDMKTNTFLVIVLDEHGDEMDYYYVDLTNLKIVNHQRIYQQVTESIIDFYEIELSNLKGEC